MTQKPVSSDSNPVVDRGCGHRGGISRHDGTNSVAFERVMCGEVPGYVGYLAIRHYADGNQVGLYAPTMAELSSAWDSTRPVRPLDTERVQRVWVCAAEKAAVARMTTASAPNATSAQTETSTLDLMISAARGIPGVAK